MPEGILRFNLPEDEDAFKLAQRGSDYFSVLWDIHNELRNWWKYDQKPIETLKRIQELMHGAEIDDIS